MQIQLLLDNQVLKEDCSVILAKDILPGEKLLTANGESVVVAGTYLEPAVMDTVSFNIKNHYSSSFCCNLLSINLQNFYNKGIKGFSQSKNKDLSFIPSSTVRSGDLVASPIIDKQINNLNHNQCALLGYFAAEGSYAKKYNKRQGVQFTLGISESKIANRIQDLFNLEFPECSIRVKSDIQRSVIVITATGSNISDFFYNNVGEYSLDKKLSESVVFATPSSKVSFLSAWLEGDGCLSKNKLIGITSSVNMAWQIKMMLNSLKIPSSIRKFKPPPTQVNKNYTIYQSNVSYRIEVSPSGFEMLYPESSYKYASINSKIKNTNQFFKNQCLHIVKNVKKLQFNGIINNIMVEKNCSLVVNGLIVS